MTQARHIIVAVAALSAVPAVAQDVGSGTHGAFELEYLRSSGSSDLLLYGDLGLSHRGSGAGGVGLGFDLGFDTSYNLSEGENATGFTAAAVFSLGFGDVAVGLPETIGEVLVDRPSFAGNGVLDDALGLVLPPTTSAIARQFEDMRYGVRFESATGQLRYGASAHKIKDQDGILLQAAGEYSFGQGAVLGVLDLGSEGGGFGGTIGVTQSFGQVDVAAFVGWQRALAYSNSAHASVDYHVSDSLTVGADLANIDAEGFKTNLIGANMEYTFGNGAYGQLGMSDGNNVPTFYDISVGIRF